jgi:hypothetical protein
MRSWRGVPFLAPHGQMDSRRKPEKMRFAISLLSDPKIVKTRGRSENNPLSNFFRSHFYSHSILLFYNPQSRSTTLQYSSTTSNSALYLKVGRPLPQKSEPSGKGFWEGQFTFLRSFSHPEAFFLQVPSPCRRGHQSGQNPQALLRD